MMKYSNVQNNITILNFYAPNKIASKYTEQVLIELHGEISKPMVYSEVHLTL